MPWQERSVESEREAFVRMAHEEGIGLAAICRHFGISRKTGYKWLARATTAVPLTDRSRRPHGSPRQTPEAIEALLLALRAQHPAWGGRKLHHRLVAAGVADVPAPSTITGILRRAGLLVPVPPPVPLQRFTHPEPNALWQMDFMGHQPLRQGRVHPWSLLDDHSRFALDLAACPNQQQTTVQTALTTAFRQYGLPQAILCDNGSPWGAAGLGGITRLEAWLLRLGVEPWHGRPYHPQTRGQGRALPRHHRAAITAAGGDYLLFVGGNQHRRYDVLTALWTTPGLLPDLRTAQTQETGHGRHDECRTLHVSATVDRLGSWPGI